MKDNGLKRNASGCKDPTAYEAIVKVDEENEFIRVSKLRHYIFKVIERNGYSFTGYFVLKNNKTGRLWRFGEGRKK